MDTFPPPATPGRLPGNQNRISATPGRDHVVRRNAGNIDLTPFNPFARNERNVPSPKVVQHNLSDYLLTPSSSPFVPRKRSRTFKFVSGVTAIPHPEKTGLGEDAYFISRCGFALGVADGVGGWADHGIDAGEYSRELMRRACDHVEDALCRDPQESLDSAYSKVQVQGSTTACIAVAEGRFIRIANLGDSGLMLFRYNRPEDDAENNHARANNGGNDPSGYWGMAFKTEDQQHYFNCPRQLGTNSSDYPQDADNYEVECMPGDIVFLATDGVIDNLSPSDMCAILDAMNIKGEEDLQKLSELVAAEASRAARDPSRRTPFAENAQAHGVNYQGGKMDDITIITALVYETDDSLPGNIVRETPTRVYRSECRTPDTKYSSSSSASPITDDF